MSVGVTVDSYVVFFERLKDEVRAGRSMRNSAQRGFAGAWRTILVADLVSLIGAAVLWYLTVGSVRGFAFFLGLSTLCDLVVAYFFTRPAVLLLARTRVDGAAQGDGHRGVVDGRCIVSTDVLPNTQHVAAAPAGGCTTARPPSTSTAGAGGASALSAAADRHHRCVSLFARASTSASTSRAASPGRCRRRTSPSTRLARSSTTNGIDGANAKIQSAPRPPGRVLLIQVGDQSVAKRQEVQEALATAAKVDAEAVSVNSVSSTWGRRSPRRRSAR